MKTMKTCYSKKEVSKVCGAYGAISLGKGFLPTMHLHDTYASIPTPGSLKMQSQPRIVRKIYFATPFPVHAIDLHAQPAPSLQN
jgi:hypothetical protein